MTSRVAAIPMIAFDTSNLKGGWELGHPGIPQQLFYLAMYNESDVDVEVSYNGDDSHDFIADGWHREINFQTNNQVPGGMKAILGKGTKIYFSGAMGTGYVYIIGYYNIERV